ncbi:TetR/AcrR family transcriptional regulator [Salinactinospora qingdaonensis]|uniref:TetR family transcriptional regulator n=1 Tax=Salinactinospora qingdaonensis TaxID=702744 RepID=A0ABP7G196_9ACTN
MPRTGRRPGATQTREQILDAAREQFADKGYNGTTIRGIARAAGVDPALVHHFFGTKEDVFTAAMQLPLNPREALWRVIGQSEGDRAETIVRFFLSIWEDPEGRAPMLAMVRSATTHEPATRAIREFMETVILNHVATNAEVSPLRASMMASQLFGMVLLRHIIGVQPLASATPEEIVQIYTPALRAVLEPPQPPEGASEVT